MDERSIINIGGVNKSDNPISADLSVRFFYTLYRVLSLSGLIVYINILELFYN